MIDFRIHRRRRRVEWLVRYLLSSGEGMATGFYRVELAPADA